MTSQSPATEKVEAARAARARGENEKAHALLLDAERLLIPGDLDGLTELWSAISMERLGDFEYEERDLKAGALLERLAEAGNVPAQEILMVDFLDGLNGRTPDFLKFVEWAERAAANGSSLAASELQKHCARSRK